LSLTDHATRKGTPQDREGEKGKEGERVEKRGLFTLVFKHLDLLRIVRISAIFRPRRNSELRRNIEWKERRKKEEEGGNKKRKPTLMSAPAAAISRLHRPTGNSTPKAAVASFSICPPAGGRERGKGGRGKKGKEKKKGGGQSCISAISMPLINWNWWRKQSA